MGIEKKVADAVLQRTQEITLHGVKFTVTQPTLATLIAISEMVADLPDMPDAEKNPLTILKDVKQCRIIGDIIATLICGVKRRKWYDFAHRWRKERLSKWVVDNCSPNEICSLLGDIMACMQLADFFVASASLKGMSVIRVAETTTAYGR